MADFRDIREILDGKVKPAVDKADTALEGLAAKVERHKLTKWILVALGVVVVVVIFLLR